MWAFVQGHCFACGTLFGFNPMRVPSYTPRGGTREPICRACIDLANTKRRAAGGEPHVIHDDAYEPIADDAW
jgi:hypothetical protein